MLCPCIAVALAGWWCQMQHHVSQTGDAAQTAGIVEIGQQGLGTGPPPVCRQGCIAQQGKDSVAPGEVRKNAAGNVSAADDKYFLHGGIVADQGKQLDEPSDQRHT